MPKVFKKDGKYLIYSESTTHTGTHRNVSWTTDLNKASTLNYIPHRVREEVGEGEFLEVKVNYSLQLASEVEEPVPGLHFIPKTQVIIRFTPDQWCLVGTSRFDAAHSLNHALETNINKSTNLSDILGGVHKAMALLERFGVTPKSYEFLNFIVPKILKGV